MAGIKISELDELTGLNADSSDILVIVDVSENTTKKIQYKNLIESQIENAETADRIKADHQMEITLRAQQSNEPLHLLVSPIGSTTSQHTAEHFAGLTGYDSVAYAYQGLYWMADSSALFSSKGIRTNGGTGRLEGIADRALVADSANFELTSINGVTDTFTGLTAGQVLKYNGTQWVNLNDNTGDVGQGVIAKLLNTKSADNADASFLVPFVALVGTDSVEVDNQLTYNPNSNTLTTTNFDGNATSANSATNADVATDAKQLTADSAPTTGTLYPLMRESKLTGTDSANFTQSLSYEVIGTGDILSAPYFSGNGSLLTNVAADSAAVAGTVELTASNTNTATNYLHFSEEASGNGITRTDTALNYRPDSDMLVAGNITTASGYIINDSAGELLISKAGTRLLRLDESGNLAIAGTLSQSQTL